MNLPIDDDFVKRVKEPGKNENQPTFGTYPMFEWKPGIPIMDEMTESEDKDLDEENA